MPERMKPRAAVFLDRDGVINHAVLRDGTPFAPNRLIDFEILPGVPEACRRLKAAGFLLVLATNQPDVGRGTMALEELEAMHRKMLETVPLDRIEICPHPGGTLSNCDCRKPKPGMLLRAARELGLDLAQCWMVGDRWRDVDCGHAAGCRTVFIDLNYAEKLHDQPDFRAKDLAEAADIILANPPKEVEH
jgi:D-glycero-D-manno-heptose 1,7-bisphosphate phosphatase